MSFSTDFADHSQSNNGSSTNGLSIRFLLWALVAFLIFLFARKMWQGAIFFDDSYMFLRYAKNLLAGYGLAWNPGGPQVFGQTSLLHLLIVTLLSAWLPIKDSWILLLSSALPAAAAAVIVAYTCARFCRGEWFRGEIAFWFAMVFSGILMNGHFFFHARTGMDTAVALLCNALVVYTTLRTVECPDSRRILALIFTAYLTCLARPDNGLYAVLFPTLAILLLARSDSRAGLLAWFLAGIGTVLCLDLIAKWHFFGHPLPLAFYAKSIGFYGGYQGARLWNPVDFLGKFIVTATPWVAILILFGRRRDLRLLAAFLIPVGLLFGYYFGVTQIMGYSSRFYFPSLPLIIVPSVLLLDARFRDHPWGRVLARTQSVSVEDDGRHRARYGYPSVGYFLAGITLLCARIPGPSHWLTRMRSRPALVRAILLLLLFTCKPVSSLLAEWYEAAFLRPSPEQSSVRYSTPSGNELPTTSEPIFEIMAEALQEAPAGTIVALTEHGLVGAVNTHLKLIDVAGLHDERYALRGFSGSDLITRKPDLIWFPHPHYTRLVRQIVDEPLFWRDYEYFPGAFEFGLAIRKDSPRRDRLMQGVEKGWTRLYGALPMRDYMAELR